MRQIVRWSRLSSGRTGGPNRYRKRRNLCSRFDTGNCHSTGPWFMWLLRGCLTYGRYQRQRRQTRWERWRTFQGKPNSLSTRIAVRAPDFLATMRDHRGRGDGSR